MSIRNEKMMVTVNKTTIVLTAIAIICFVFVYNSIRDIQLEAFQKGYQAGYQAYYQEVQNNVKN